MGERRWSLATGLAVSLVLLGTNVAWASFTSAANTSVSPAYAAYTLATPTLDCNPGGLLAASVVLNLHSTDPSTKISGYDIERTGPNDNTYVFLDSVVLPTSSYSDPAPAAALSQRIYKYRIKAKKWNWASANYSNVVTATVAALGASRTCV